jgi:hypothetical protein
MTTNLPVSPLDSHPQKGLRASTILSIVVLLLFVILASIQLTFFLPPSPLERFQTA